MLRSVPGYLGAIGREWRSWLTGSAVLAVFGLVLDVVPDLNVPWWGWAALLLTGLAFAQFRAWDRLKARVDVVEDQLRPRLAIEARDAPEHRKTWVSPGQTRHYYCRIGVRNRSAAKAIEGVTVRILRLDGEPDFDAPQTLDPKRQTINGGAFQNWTIAEGEHLALGEDTRLRINVNHRGLPFRTAAAAKDMRLRIEASAADAPPVVRDFFLRKDDQGRPSLAPAETT